MSNGCDVHEESCESPTEQSTVTRFSLPTEYLPLHPSERNNRRTETPSSRSESSSLASKNYPDDEIVKCCGLRVKRRGYANLIKAKKPKRFYDSFTWKERATFRRLTWGVLEFGPCDDQEDEEGLGKTASYSTNQVEDVQDMFSVDISEACGTQIEHDCTQLEQSLLEEIGSVTEKSVTEKSVTEKSSRLLSPSSNEEVCPTRNCEVPASLPTSTPTLGHTSNEVSVSLTSPPPTLGHSSNEVSVSLPTPLPTIGHTCPRAATQATLPTSGKCISDPPITTTAAVHRCTTYDVSGLVFHASFPRHHHSNWTGRVHSAPKVDNLSGNTLTGSGSPYKGGMVAASRSARKSDHSKSGTKLRIISKRE